jgi:hypothetical protein
VLREKGDSEVAPNYENLTCAHAEGGQTARCGQAERSAQGGSGVSPDCGSVIRLCANEAKRSDHAERSGKRVPLDYSSNQRAAKARRNAEKPAVYKRSKTCRLQEKEALALLWVFLGSGRLCGAREEYPI